MILLNERYFLQLGTVHLCRSVIRSIETARIFDFEEFPVKDKVDMLDFCREILSIFAFASVYCSLPNSVHM